MNNNVNNPKAEDDIGKNIFGLGDLLLDMWHQLGAIGLTGACLCAKKNHGVKITANSFGGSIVNDSDFGFVTPCQLSCIKEEFNEDLQPLKPIMYSVVKTELIELTRYLSTYWAGERVGYSAGCSEWLENDHLEFFVREAKTQIGKLATTNNCQGILMWVLSVPSIFLNGPINPIKSERLAW